jgi:hypothetical protein
MEEVMNRIKQIFLSSLLAIIIIGFYAPSAARGQSGSTAASVTGTVTDEQGAIIPGVIVTARSLQTNFTRETQSGEDGSFLITQLPPGTYELTVTAEGFTTKTSRLDLVLGTTTLFNFSMSIGANSEVIVVTASNTVGEEKTESSTNIGRERIDSLPINRRNFMDFSLTSPRVTLDRTPQQGVAASSGVSFNGQPARQNNITIDGLDNNDLGAGAVRSTFSQDAVQEFQVVSDSYSAEFGRALGGVINIVTRGGGNENHGSAFFFNRNDTISARDVFAPFKPPYKQYQFGAALSGPIRKDRAFFFTSFERLSIKQNNFITIGDETVRAANRQGFALRNGPAPFALNTTTFLARADAKLGANDTLYVRYNYGGTFNGAFEPFGGLTGETNSALQMLRDNTIATSNTYISAGLNLVNETRFLYSRRNQDVLTGDPGPQVNIVAPEGLTIFGRGTLTPQPREIRIYQVVDNVTLTRGRNQIKFGADLAYIDAPLFRVPVFSGGFAFFPPLDFAVALGNPSFPSFTGLQNFDPSLRTPEQRMFLTALAQLLPAAAPGFPKGVPLADLALPAAFAQGFLEKDAAGTNTSAKLFSIFFQDDIKLRQNLTLKLGMRYDINRVRFIPNNNGNFSPRVALTYRPERLPKLSAHASYGLFFAAPLFGPATVPADSGLGALKIPVIPFPFSVLFYSLPGHHLPEGEKVPPGVPFIPQLSLEFTLEPNMRASYSQQINTGFNYFLDNNTAFSVIYAFVRGIKIFSQRNINPIVRPIPGDPVGSAITGRVDPTRGDVFEFASVYDSYYHGVTLLINKRLTGRFGFFASYTFSKAIDNFIDIRNELQQSVDPLNPAGERGLSLQDLRNRFVISGIWKLNYTKNPFLRDFQLSTIISLESGRPYNLLAGVDLNMNGDNPPGDRPARLGRNAGITPGYANVDLRLTRTVAINERYQIQGFIEAFNLFNRVNISEVNTIFPPDAQGNFNLPSKQGGRFSAPRERYRNAFAPRQFQFGFRFTF